MDSSKVFSALVAAGLALGAAGLSLDAVAQPTKGSTAPPDPPLTQVAISLPLNGIAFGATPQEVTVAVNKILDEDYKPLYAKVSPGVKMKQLDAALAEEKNAFARSLIKFDLVPKVPDSGPLKGEYTYNNKESKLALSRKGVTHHFFFIQEKLWKLISEHKLGENEAIGKDFADAVAKLAKQHAVAGRTRAADASKGLQFREVDWRDTKTHLRAIDRGAYVLGMGYEDNATLQLLDTLRANKPVSGLSPKK